MRQSTVVRSPLVHHVYAIKTRTIQAAHIKNSPMKRLNAGITGEPETARGRSRSVPSARTAWAGRPSSGSAPGCPRSCPRRSPTRRRRRVSGRVSSAFRTQVGPSMPGHDHVGDEDVDCSAGVLEQLAAPPRRSRPRAPCSPASAARGWRRRAPAPRPRPAGPRPSPCGRPAPRLPAGRRGSRRWPVPSCAGKSEREGRCPRPTSLSAKMKPPVCLTMP